MKSAKVNGETLRNLRLRAGMTIKALSEKSKLSEQTIEYIEKGKRKHINDATLLGLAAALGIDVVLLREKLQETEVKTA
jgi:transcriptional regulator with XRE-family HTH domain